MKFNSILVLLAFQFLFAYSAKAQSRNVLNVKMNGYMIFTQGDVIFQPCENNKIDIWSALDNRSFSIQCNMFIDQYCDAIEHIGDSEIVRLAFNSDSNHIMNVRFSYFFCSLNINMSLLSRNENDFYIYDIPQYSVWHKEKKIMFKGFYIRETIQSIIPDDKEKQKMMYNYYVTKHYAIPEWLKSLIQ